MITRYRFFGITLWIRSGETYTSKIVLKEGDGRSIVKEEGGNEACYSMYLGDRQLSYINGYIDDQTFHIWGIENVAREDKVPAFATLPVVLEAMESDLVSRGIKRLTATALVRIAPIAVKRYGFSYAKGHSPKRDLLKWVPGRAAGLEKRLT